LDGAGLTPKTVRHIILMMSIHTHTGIDFLLSMPIGRLLVWAADAKKLTEEER
jgi:hypothetical protein